METGPDGVSVAQPLPCDADSGLLQLNVTTIRVSLARHFLRAVSGQDEDGLVLGPSDSSFLPS